MYILGISAFYHDSAAALICNGKIIAAAQEERFTRKKHDAGFPENAIRYCLEEEGIELSDISIVAFYDKPFLKFERLLETYYAFAPKGFGQFVKAMPVWLKEKLFLKKLLKDSLKEIGNFEEKKTKILFPEHHLSHAASTFYPSPFEDAAILTLDGVGEWDTASVASGKGNGITVHKVLHFPHSLGLLYSSFTFFLGFRVNSGEYKLMGLAPYGNPDDPVIEKYKNTILTSLVDLHEDGSFRLNPEYFTFATGVKMVNEKLWEKLFGFAARKPEAPLELHHCNLGLAIQQVTEEIVIRMAKEAQRITGSKNLCLAGGVALNCVANGKLLQSGIFESVFVQPASGDAGGALGAALAACYIYSAQVRQPEAGDSLNGSYLGPEFPDKVVRNTAFRFHAVFEQKESMDAVYPLIAEALSQGKIVGWFQGRMEFGPRALGNRSILADARNPEMQKKLNLRIKFREGFRPFAPAVLEESASLFFEMEGHSPYMLFTFPVKPSLRNSLPENYASLPLSEKLYFSRSVFPSITHIDFSARIQTVHSGTNPRFYRLLKAFEKITGQGILINTSFNVRGEPPVCTPEDAYRCFMRTDMDILVMNQFVFMKENQPEWKEEKGVIEAGID
ncbi:MAG: carbamoyltransferase [Bacteroidia bacterium]|nr:carbamoyltransferase [Bacteroidia bacterium]